MVQVARSAGTPGCEIRRVRVIEILRVCISVSLYLCVSRIVLYFDHNETETCSASADTLTPNSTPHTFAQHSRLNSSTNIRSFRTQLFFCVRFVVRRRAARDVTSQHSAAAVPHYAPLSRSALDGEHLLALLVRT